MRLDIKDVYEQPEGWDERQEWLGEFDEEKYAFMVTVSKQAFSKENNHMWNETDKYNLELREALDEFNANDSTGRPEEIQISGNDKIGMVGQTAEIPG